MGGAQMPFTVDIAASTERSIAQRILVCEDNHLIAAGLASILAREGYTVLGPVDTGEEALRTAFQDLPDLALLDAELTLGLPPAVTAATGIDAMVHAIEAYTSALKKNPMSDLLAREALRLLAANLDEAVHNGSNREARQAMLLGACLAGQAFANAPVAAVHALAYPLGGNFHIPHGLSNALVLPQVLRFNVSAAATHYGELAPIILGERLRTGDPSTYAEQLIAEFEQMSARVGLPTRLRDAGVPEDMLPQLAKEAMLQQRLLVNNPREVSEADALAIYQAAY